MKIQPDTKKKERQFLRSVLKGIVAAGLFFVIPVSAGPRRPANGSIAFTSERDGNPEIYTVKSDGSGETRLTNNNIVDDAAAWSPDGKNIAFVSQNDYGQFAIFTMTAVGGGRAEVTRLDYFSRFLTTLNWSPDGRKIVFSDSVSGTFNGTDLFTVNVNGSGKTNLTSDHAHFDGFPVWSPDGLNILFSRYDTYPPVGYGGTMLHIIKFDGTGLTALENGFADGWNEDFADWSPVTNKIIYSVNRWDHVEDLFIASPDGTKRTYIEGCNWTSTSCRWHALHPRFSPDASKVVFTKSNFEGGDQIFTKNLADGRMKLLVNNARNPSWQPRRIDLSGS